MFGVCSVLYHFVGRVRCTSCRPFILFVLLQCVASVGVGISSKRLRYLRGASGGAGQKWFFLIVCNSCCGEGRVVFGCVENSIK